jgi:hypothetical protein
VYNKGNVHKCEPKLIYWPSNYKININRVNFKMTKPTKNGEEKRQKHGGAVTGLEWPRVFQEVKVPRFHDKKT